jgi:hypothetical protein
MKIHGGDNAASGPSQSDMRRIVSAQQLLKYSGGARLLQGLTNTTTGFGCLEVLDLHITAVFHFANHQATVDVYRAVGFSVVAGAVNLRIINELGFSEDWHPSLAQAIGL